MMTAESRKHGNRKGRLLMAVLAAAFVCLAFGLPARDEPLKITAATDRAEGAIGDPFRLDVTVETAAGVTVLNVEPPADTGVFEIRETRAPEEKKDAGAQPRTWEFVLSTLEDGQQILSGFQAVYSTPEGEIRKMPVPPVSIQTLPIPAAPGEEDKIRPPRGPMDIAPRPYLRNFLLMCAGVLVLLGAAAILLARYWGKRVREPEPVRTQPRPIDEIALEDLAALEASPLIAQGRIKEYYSSAAHIIRVYLGGRHEWDMMDLTSDEILTGLEMRSSMTQVVMRTLSLFLERCDMVKFARYKPDGDAHRKTLVEARRVVTETTSKASGEQTEGVGTGPSGSRAERPEPGQAPTGTPVGGEGGRA
ncbi:MAG TPA: hypothetical protein PLB62_02640 [Candidatus Sumerlaeota bacterium]|nr:hypothetical protein [Candidatus Sumerlaeota bacterium]